MGMTRFLVIFLAVLLFVGSSASAPQLVVDPSIAWQGKIVCIKVPVEEGISAVSGRFLNQDFACYKSADDFRGIIGVPINQKPGHYNLKLIITCKNGKLETLTRKMKVWTTKFPFSRYWLKPHKKKLLRRDLVNRDWAQIAKVLRVERTEQLWQGKFIKPVREPISQGFGHRQIVNGRRAGNHRGVDFATPIGTEVKAPNKGRVVFRKYLEVFGGTMVINHGQGIHTLYFHLSKCFPEVGQMVAKGDVIALSGNSGVSSGPHLHWGMSVHDLRVDPLQWTKHEI
jgi:hypothetical protein